MLIADRPAVERIIALTINETARGDPDAVAARIVAALAEAGYFIAPANRMACSQLANDRAAVKTRPSEREEPMTLPRAADDFAMIPPA